MTIIAFLVLFVILFAYFEIKTMTLYKRIYNLRDEVYGDIDLLTENLVSVVKGFNKMYFTVYPQGEPKKSLTKKK